MRRGLESRRTALAALASWAVLLACAATGCADDGGTGNPTGPTSAPAAPDLSDATLWLSFEDEDLTFEGDPQYPDALGKPYAGVVVTANDGAVDVVAGAGGTGDGIGFPERCDEPVGCPRAMVEVAPDPALDPGAGDFEFGAAVWLAPDQTTKGSNIVQRGRFDSRGGLWKLQVDSVEGRPSCVVRSEGEDPLIVRSSVRVSDSSWHRVSCRRDASGIEIEVDGDAERATGPTGSVDSELPLRIGSPGVGDQDDQFHGRVDDVFLRIAPPV